MRTLLTSALAAAAGVAIAEAVCVFLIGLTLALSMAVALPIAAGCAGFMIAGRRRALRRQRSRAARRRVSGEPQTRAPWLE